MVQVINKKGDVLNCLGVFKTPGEDNSFFAKDHQPSTAWGRGGERPFIPTEEDFTFGQPEFEAGFIRLQLNTKAGFRLA